MLALLSLGHAEVAGESRSRPAAGGGVCASLRPAPGRSDGCLIYFQTCIPAHLPPQGFFLSPIICSRNRVPCESLQRRGWLFWSFPRQCFFSPDPCFPHDPDGIFLTRHEMPAEFRRLWTLSPRQGRRRDRMPIAVHHGGGCIYIFLKILLIFLNADQWTDRILYTRTEWRNTG